MEIIKFEFVTKTLFLYATFLERLCDLVFFLEF